ncbi:MAG: AAA family ATPase, partial [Bacilli bacterium]
DETKIVDENVIEDIISRICSIPKQKVENEEVSSLKKLDSILKSNVFGQNEAINEVVRCIKMSRAGLNDDNKPVASMLFVGPTGVGKTEIAKTLSKTLAVDLVRFDMSEYVEKHAASKLIGSPPGYVGYEEGGLLTDSIRKKPNCVLLLDEVEKAHEDILNVLLQVMDYATLTDNQGRKVDFRNVVLIMTSNAGAKNIGKTLVGFGNREVKGEAITEEVRKIFTPEFRNRLDKIVVFNHVDDSMAEKIVEKEL